MFLMLCLFLLSLVGHVFVCYMYIANIIIVSNLVKTVHPNCGNVFYFSMVSCNLIRLDALLVSFMASDRSQQLNANTILKSY